MKYLLTLSALLLCFQLFAQKIHYSDKRNRWVTKGTFPGDIGCEFWRIVSFGDDTTVNGITYQKLMSGGTSEINGSMECYGGPPYPRPFILIREDTTANMVYYVDLSNADTNEYVLYNFNLSLGDTIHYPNGSELPISHTDSVIRLDSTIINGVYHKVYAFNMRENPYHRYTIVEGVGSLTEYWQPFNICFEGGEILYCFYQDTTFVPVTAPFFAYCESYLYTHYPDTFYSTAPLCQTLTVTDILKHNYLKVFPNPANDHINITAGEPIDGLTIIELFSATGQLVSATSERQLKQSAIDCSNLPNGVYFLLFLNEKTVFSRQKITIYR